MRHNSLSFLDYRGAPRGDRTALPLQLTRQAESFPLPRYTSRVYPPHVTDEHIKQLIRELTRGDQLPSGAQLRTVLYDRFKSRGGVTRVYRLLSAERATSQTGPAPSSSVSVGRLEHEIKSLKEALKLADYREQTHQSRWALEVDRLRQQVLALEPLALKSKTALDTADLLRRQLHAAHVRITELEQQLLDVRGPDFRVR